MSKAFHIPAKTLGWRQITSISRHALVSIPHSRTKTFRIDDVTLQRMVNVSDWFLTRIWTSLNGVQHGSLRKNCKKSTLTDVEGLSSLDFRALFLPCSGSFSGAPASKATPVDHGEMIK